MGPGRSGLQNDRKTIEKPTFFIEGCQTAIRGVAPWAAFEETVKWDEDLDGPSRKHEHVNMIYLNGWTKSYQYFDRAANKI